MKEENYKEKIKLECQRTNNQIVFMEKKKLLTQKYKELTKKIKQDKIYLDKKVHIYKKNENNLNYLNEQNQIFAKQNQDSLPRIRIMKENLDDQELKLTVKNIENENLKRLLVELK